jgi:hypothetical protein
MFVAGSPDAVAIMLDLPARKRSLKEYKRVAGLIEGARR